VEKGLLRGDPVKILKILCGTLCTISSCCEVVEVVSGVIVTDFGCHSTEALKNLGKICTVASLKEI
jgi:hypothetical protein